MSEGRGISTVPYIQMFLSMCQTFRYGLESGFTTWQAKFAVEPRREAVKSMESCIYLLARNEKADVP